MRALTLALLAAASTSAAAVTVLPLSFPQLVDASTAILHGRVVDVHGQWRVDRRGIESLVTVEVADTLKGDLGRRVTVRVPGGEAGGLVNLIPGAPRFARGDEVVLFLTGAGPGLPVVTGTSQGVFRVLTDPRTGDRLVVPPVIAPLTGTSRLHRGAELRRPMTLVALAQAVAAARGVEP